MTAAMVNHQWQQVHMHKLLSQKRMLSHTSGPGVDVVAKVLACHAARSNFDDKTDGGCRRSPVSLTDHSAR